METKKYITTKDFECMVEGRPRTEGKYRSYLLNVPKGTVIAKGEIGMRCVIVDGTHHYLGSGQYLRIFFNVIEYTPMSNTIFAN